MVYLYHLRLYRVVVGVWEGRVYKLKMHNDHIELKKIYKLYILKYQPFVVRIFMKSHKQYLIYL